MSGVTPSVTPAERGRGDTHDGDGVRVEPQRASNDATVATETTLPVAMTENGHQGSGVVIVGGIEQSAECGPDAEHVVHVAGREQRRGQFRAILMNRVAIGERSEGKEAREHLIVIAEHPKAGIRDVAPDLVRVVRVDAAEARRAVRGR